MAVSSAAPRVPASLVTPEPHRIISEIQITQFSLKKKNFTTLQTLYKTFKIDEDPFMS